MPPRVIYSRRSASHLRPVGNDDRSQTAGSVKKIPGRIQVPHPSQVHADGRVDGAAFAGKRARRDNENDDEDEEEEDEEEEDEDTDNEGSHDDEDADNAVTTTDTAEEYFRNFTNAMTPGMLALRNLGNFSSYKPLDARDVLYHRTRPRTNPNLNRDARVNKSFAQLLAIQAREIRKWSTITTTTIAIFSTVSGTDLAPPLRYICYLPHCAYSSNNARELIRHFNQSSPNIHPNETFNPARVFDVPHRDWVRDQNLACSAAAGSTVAWYREFKLRGLGANLVEDRIGEDEEDGDGDGDGEGETDTEMGY